MRRDCNPYLVDGDKHQPLRRLEFTNQDLKEGWLQKILGSSPALLPVEELDESFAPLVSLGREILKIDNLFVSPSGRLTLVETKLWRNPEAVREALSQIMDYAQKLRGMSVEELTEKARQAKDPTLKPGQSLWGLVHKRYPEETKSEPHFIDALGRSLKDARFMLLVVGDGIKENLEGIVALLHTQPQMLFTFGLVELQVYETQAFKGRLVVPQIVAHSTEIVRAVVKVKAEGRAEVVVEMEHENDPAKTKRIRLDEAEFYETVKDDDVRACWKSIVSEAKSLGYVLKSSSASVSLGLPNPRNQGKQLHLFRLRSTGEAYPTTKLGNDKGHRVIFGKLVGAMGELFEAQVKDNKNGVPLLTPRPKGQQVIAKQQQLLKILKATADDFAAHWAE